MAGLALLIAGLGLFSGAALRTVAGVAASAANIQGAPAADKAQLSSVGLQNGFAETSMPAVFIGIAAAVLAVTVAVMVFTRKRRVVTGRTWDCGSDLTPRMEITATGFSRSLITISRRVLRPSSETEIEYHDATGYFPKAGMVTMGLHDIYQTYIYRPLRDLTTLAAGQFTRIQSGNINAYILYIFLALIGLLFFVDLQA
jgi:hydrogenase-4 component B